MNKVMDPKNNTNMETINDPNKIISPLQELSSIVDIHGSWIPMAITKIPYQVRS